jgi:hypothetical protein
MIIGGLEVKKRADCSDGLGGWSRETGGCFSDALLTRPFGFRFYLSWPTSPRRHKVVIGPSKCWGLPLAIPMKPSFLKVVDVTCRGAHRPVASKVEMVCRAARLSNH